MYVCILKSKRAEWVALSELDDKHRDAVQVILELIPAPAVEGGSVSTSAFNVLTTTGRTTAGEFLSKELDLAVDARLLPKTKQVLVAARVAAKLCKAGYNASPSVSVSAILGEAASLPELADAKVVVVRVPMLSVSTAQATQAVKDLRKTIGKKAKLRVVLDAEDFAGNIDDDDLIKAAASLTVAIKASGQPNQIAFAGGSFPQSLMGIPQGRKEIERREWRIWNKLRSKPNCGDVLYGDYTVTHPKPTKLEVDPRLLKPSPAIRYAIDGAWTLYKGVRPKKGVGFGQYKALCQLLIGSKDYYGEPFSFGDKMYTHHADEKTTNGSPQTWRRDATSHHIVQTLEEL
jgi:hypothetical protein